MIPSPSVEGREKQSLLKSLSLGLAISPTHDKKQQEAKGYLQVKFFAKDSTLVSEEQLPLTIEAEEEWQQMRLSAKAQEDGYAMVTVLSEGEGEVWTDDVSIVHEGAMIVQENHYDPWGMNLAGIEKAGLPDYKHQYNAMVEKQADVLSKGYFYETDYRGYDPQLGRFRGIDIMASALPGITPYQYAFNNPIMFNDPRGDFPIGIAIGAAVGGGVSAFIAAKNGASMGEIALAGIGGAIAGGIMGGMIEGVVGMGAGGGGSLAPAAGETLRGGGDMLARELVANLVNEQIQRAESFKSATASNGPGPGNGWIPQRGDYPDGFWGNWWYKFDRFMAQQTPFGPGGFSNTLRNASQSYRFASSLKKLLPSWKKIKIDLTHILDNHTRTGKGAISSAKATGLDIPHQMGNKSLFPEYMNEKQIENAVKQAYRNVEKYIETQQGVRKVLRGKTDDGLLIEMIYNIETNIIETAYPLWP